MSLSSFCPGSRAVKEPTPENYPCPNCGEEVEVWSHELSYPCSKCGTRVFRVQRPSCIDWCSHAKECVGAELYNSLKPKKVESPVSGTPLESLLKDHQEALTKMAQLRATTICLKVKANAPADQAAPSLKNDLDHLDEIMAFFGGELKEHFEKEEKGLFPMLERHVKGDSGPVGVLLAEHQDFWKKYELLKARRESLVANGNQGAIANEMYDISSQIIILLRGHIEKENTTLLPLARKLFSDEEFQELKGTWAEGKHEILNTKS